MSFTIDPQAVETRIINGLVDFDGLRVLEVGCGEGRMTWRFAKKASSVLAVDVNEAKIEAAKRATPEDLRAKVRFEATDITRTQLHGDLFDAAVLSYSLWCIPLEGVVHALRQIHHSLSPDGVLLDVHPQPVNSRIEVWQDGRVHDLGEIDQQEDHREIEDARVQLELLVKDGLFSPETSDFFELHEHHDSVASWRERWADEEYRLVAPPEMFESAERLLSLGGGELVIREQVRAIRLRRSAG